MVFITKHKLVFVGVIAGAIGGYLYYHFIGCSSGTCAITSKPVNSTLYGATIGGLLFSLFKTQNKK
jgi:phage shock protein E